MRLCSLLLSAALALSAQEMQEFQKKITEFSLPNGLHFVLLERHESPVISFHTYIAAGSVDDPAGETGLAHMFEHMAFKGSETLGTRNWTDERKALDSLEETLNKAEAESRKGLKADEIRVDGLRTQARQAAETAQRYSAAGDFRRLLEENGGVNLNAVVNSTYSETSYSLPSNRAELWFLTEAQRLSRPAFREFYSERSLMLDEYRQRAEGTPQGKVMAELLAAAFKTHPYRNPVGGWPSDIQNLRRTEAQEFFERYYVPGNMTVALVGDITLAEAKRLAEKYFGTLPAKPLPPRVTTQEPPQSGPKTVVLELQGPQMAMVGYKRPSQFDRDDVALDMLQILFSQGRSGLLYRELVQEKRVAQQAQATATNPDGYFSNLFVFMLVPGPGRTVEDTQRALDEMLLRFKSTPLDPQLVTRAKVMARANLIRRMNSNQELASLLALHAGMYGDWHRLFTQLDDVDKVKPEDLQRAANRYFVATGRTTVYNVGPGQSDAPAAKPGERRAGGLQ
ncbi:MAG: pitrilysin family protein [Candidatus Solibacter sp.]